MRTPIASTLLLTLALTSTSCKRDFNEKAQTSQSSSAAENDVHAKEKAAAELGEVLSGLESKSGVGSVMAAYALIAYSGITQKRLEKNAVLAAFTLVFAGAMFLIESETDKNYLEYRKYTGKGPSSGYILIPSTAAFDGSAISREKLRASSDSLKNIFKNVRILLSKEEIQSIYTAQQGIYSKLDAAKIKEDKKFQAVLSIMLKKGWLPAGDKDKFALDYLKFMKMKPGIVAKAKDFQQLEEKKIFATEAAKLYALSEIQVYNELLNRPN